MNTENTKRLSLNNKIITTCIIGTTLEWYDIALFGALTPYLSQVFFPNKHHVASLLFTLLIFTSGFIIRPIGAIIIGHLGDRKGRKSTFTFTLILMSFSTMLIGCLPSYNSIGYSAPFLLLLLRLIQGLAVSGEHSGAIIYLYELKKGNSKGLISSLSFLGVILGTLLATIMSFILNYFLSSEVLLDWGWRIPFIFSILLSVIGYYIRKISTESPIFTALLEQNLILQYPAKTIFKIHKTTLISSILMLAITYVVFYTIVIYAPLHLTQINKISELSALCITSLNLAAMAFIIPLIGYFSDKIDFKILMKLSVFGFVILTYPLFHFIQQGDFKYIVYVLLSYSILNAVYLTPTAVMITELFPSNVRYTAISITFNIAAALFGGTAPFFLKMIEHLNDRNIFIFSYISIIALLSYISIHKLPHPQSTEIIYENSKRSLYDNR